MEIKKYISKYFFDTEKIISKYFPEKIVTMQFFQRKKDVILAGITEVLELLEKNTKTQNYQIKYLPDGTKIKPMEVVLELEGHYKEFGIFEGIIDGILARNSSIATNTYHCVQAAGKKEVIYMGDRADHYLNQSVDGQAVEIAASSIGYSTYAQARGKEEMIFGSVPHVLLQHFNGDLAKAMKAYAETITVEDIVALVDYNNDVITDSLSAFKVLGKALKGVRIDTSRDVSDKMFANKTPQYGVNVAQIKALRKALDDAGAQYVRIIVSSGFDPVKIAQFEKENTPVDAYGVGEYILQINVNFSCDAVLNDGKPEAKVGRKYSNNPNLLVYAK